MDYEMDVDPALAAAVLELELHHAKAGWDRPAQLYALVDTGKLVASEPELAAQLGLDSPQERGSLTPIEQEPLAEGEELEQVLPGIVWPEMVVGCAAVLERLVLPPSADADVPEDPAAAAEFAATHPDREEVRIVAGVTRHGASYCALRLRREDDDAAVMGGTDVVPNLIALLQATLVEDVEDVEDDTEDSTDE